MAWGPVGYVYFVFCPVTRLVKIGWSVRHPDERLKTFRLGSGAPLERFGYIRADQTLERRLHVRFRHLREHGEWFRLDDDLTHYIEEHAERWDVVHRSCADDHEQFRASRDRYHEIARELMMEWAQTYDPMFSRSPQPTEHANFFEFARARGFRFRRSDRAMVKMVKGKPVLYYYEYKD